MKHLFLIASLISFAVAQQPSVTCLYYYIFNNYNCLLTIINPDGLNDFTEVEGIHLEGFSNLDVRFIYSIDSNSLNVPSIICETFPNISSLYLDETGLTEITDDSFRGCSQITELTLTYNRIISISANAFVGLPELTYIYMEFNLLTTLPENVFANQNVLRVLRMGHNPINDIPAGLFAPLTSLENIFITNTNINEINNQWFASNERLSGLYISNNRIRLTPDSLAGLNRLNLLDLGYNLIDEIPAGTFAGIQNLEYLYLYGNQIPDLQEDSFPNLGSLTYLDISENPIEVIHDGAFRGLVNLTRLDVVYTPLHRLNQNSFEDLRNLQYLNIYGNQLEELPQGLFLPSPNLGYVDFWRNRLKTFRRGTFGTLESLETLVLDENVVNAIDRSIFDDAVNLSTFYFSRNLCASGFFGDFEGSREQFMAILEQCFSNMRYIIDITTNGEEEFTFFEGLHPGIACSVTSDNEIHFGLTSFDFMWTPSIEILIGTANNTRSVIRINQETDVVAVPTPNIISRNRRNDFRVTWANHNILVYRDNDTFPFMSFTMQDIFPVNFYGLKAVERASWSVQPFNW